MKYRVTTTVEYSWIADSEDYNSVSDIGLDYEDHSYSAELYSVDLVQLEEDDEAELPIDFE